MKVIRYPSINILYFKDNIRGTCDDIPHIVERRIVEPEDPGSNPAVFFVINSEKNLIY